MKKFEPRFKAGGATTIVLVLATSAGLLVCASVGDSRAFQWGPGNATFGQVTVDDTIENELKNIPGNHAALLQERGLRGRLSQAIGEDGRTAEDLRVQIYTRESFFNGIVVGSDGAWRVSQDFATVAAEAPTASDLVRRAINLANWVGGVDNTSIIAIEDLNRFCKPGPVDPTSDLNRHPSVTIWAHLHKSKLVVTDWPRDTPPTKVVGRPKKKATKSKVVATEGKQLQLETPGEEDAKPKHKLEVTIGDAPKG